MPDEAAPIEAFVSYAREDRELVDALAESLGARGRRIWYDREILPRTEWSAELATAITAAEHFLVVLSPDWLASRISAEELRQAIDQQKPLVPLLARDVDDEAVPEDVRRLQWIDARDPAGREETFARLITALDTDLDAARAHTRLLVRASEWHRKGRRRADLLRGEDLAEAETFVATGQPLDVQREYVRTSRGHARSVRRWTIATALVVIVAIAAFVLQRGVSEQKDREARSRQYAARALDLFRTDPDQALLVAVEAGRVAPTVEAKRVLWEGLQSAPNLAAVLAPRSKSVNAMALAPDGRLAAVGAFDGIIMLLDIAGRRVVAGIQGKSVFIEHLAWSGDGRMLVSANDRGDVTLWDTKSWKQLHAFHFGNQSVGGLALHPRGRLLAIERTDRVELWDLETRALASTPIVVQKGIVTSLAFNANGELLAAGTNDGRVFLRSMPESSPIGAPYILPAGISVTALAFTSDSRVLAAGGENGMIALVRTSDFGTVVPSLFGHKERVYALDFDPRDELLASASADGTVRLSPWRESDDTQRPLVFHREDAIAVAFGPDGKTLVSAGWDGRVLLWNTVARQAIPHAADRQFRLPVASAGTRTARGGDDGTITITDRGKEIVRVPAHGARVRKLGYSADGSLLMSLGEDRRVNVWDRKMRPVRDALMQPVNTFSAALSPDGSTIATATPNALTLWDVRSGQTLGAAVGGWSDVWHLEFSADGSTLTVVDGDRAVLLDASLDRWSARACEIANRSLSPIEWQNVFGRDEPYRATCGVR